MILREPVFHRDVAIVQKGPIQKMYPKQAKNHDWINSKCPSILIKIYEKREPHIIQYNANFIHACIHARTHIRMCISMYQVINNFLHTR